MVTAYDSGAPLAEVSGTVTITIDRNLNAPLFDQQLYETTMYDYEPIGSSVVIVNAEDADITSPENLVSYDIVNSLGNSVFDMFSIHPITGLITTNRALTTDVTNVYRVSTLFSLEQSSIDLILPY